jgi:hypothetical protein
MAIIKLTTGEKAIVDDIDYDDVVCYKWYRSGSNGKYYAMRYAPNNTRVSMHAQIMGFQRDFVDHKNGNGLDNRRQNLRTCTRSQNMANSCLSKRSKSGLKGVFYDNRIKKYHVNIMLDRKHFSVGYFALPCIAARAYDTMARRMFGEFARLNCPSLQDVDIEKLRSKQYKISKHKNVEKNGKNWTARKIIDGKRYYIGTYKTEDLAYNAVQKFLKDMSLESTI